MIITLVHEEITEALKDYANKVIQVGPDREINIDLKAGRGENGYTATLDIVPKRSTSTSDTPLNRTIAHVKEVAAENGEISLADGDFVFNDEVCREIRKDLQKHAENFEKIKEKLTV